MVLSLASGSKLAADYYRLYIPNQVNTTSTGTKIDSRIYDIYGNQLDGEFLGDATSTLDNSATEFPAQPPVSTQFSGIFNYEDQLSTGVYRQGMSGDGVAGGAFMTVLRCRPTRDPLGQRRGAQQHRLCPARLRGRSASARHGPRRQPGQALFDPGAGGRPRHGAG